MSLSLCILVSVLIYSVYILCLYELIADSLITMRTAGKKPTEMYRNSDNSEILVLKGHAAAGFEPATFEGEAQGLTH